jgi:hypothetical protein
MIYQSTRLNVVHRHLSQHGNQNSFFILCVSADPPRFALHIKPGVMTELLAPVVMPTHPWNLAMVHGFLARFSVDDALFLTRIADGVFDAVPALTRRTKCLFQAENSFVRLSQLRLDLQVLLHSDRAGRQVTFPADNPDAWANRFNVPSSRTINNSEVASNQHLALFEFILRWPLAKVTPHRLQTVVEPNETYQFVRAVAACREAIDAANDDHEEKTARYQAMVADQEDEEGNSSAFIPLSEMPATPAVIGG